MLISGPIIRQIRITDDFKYNYYISETKTSKTSTAASSSGEEGVEIITSSLSHKVSKDTRDSFLNPSSGYFLSFTNSLAGFGGDSSFYKSVFKTKSFYPIK